LKRGFTVTILFLGLLFQFTDLPKAQQPGESRVGYTIARSHRISETVKLPGTVESRLISTVASEVSGLVIEYSVREGQKIEKGQVLARLRKEDIELRLREARAQLMEDEARLELAERTTNRIRELLEKGAASQQDLDDNESEFNALQRRIERLRAVIDQLDYDLQRTVITAPFSGIVVQESTQLGEWIDVGGTVIELMSMDQLEVRIDLPERFFDSVRLGTRSRVSFEAIPGVEVSGTISAIIPRADPQSRTFPVRLKIPNESGRIGVGMLAEVDLFIGSSFETTIIPKDAVVVQGRTQFVFVLDDESVVHQTEVQTGTALGAWIAVKGSIQPGQRIITRGNERLRDGTKVRAGSEEIEYELP
jgi:RND family efflux transporter MFP subunit